MGNKIGICRFCGEKKQLIKSHIIPKGLYLGLKDESGKPAQLVSPFDGEYQKKRPIGIYGHFLCAEDEKRFGQWDNYTIGLLRDPEPTKVDDGWKFFNIDYENLKLFFISLLWRAHVTDNSFFDIDLGPHGDRLKKHIVNNDPGAPNEYAVLLARSEELYAKTVIAPRRQRFEGLNFIRFYFPGYVALIKVDQRQLPSSLQQYALNCTGEWFVPQKQFEGTMEEAIIMNTAKKNWNRKHGSTR